MSNPPKYIFAVVAFVLVAVIAAAIIAISFAPETPPESKPTTTAPGSVPTTAPGTTPTGTVAPTPGSVPTTAPVIPTTNPTVPTEPATRPTTQPTEPTTAPTQPTTQPTEPPHVHEYTSEVAKEATCSAEGVKTFTCACGDSYTEKIAKLEHSYTSKVTAPTCTEGGYTTYTCACGDTYTADETAATDHSWGKWTTTQAATEQAPGKEARSCGACDAKEEREIPKLEHKHSYSSKVTKEATCTEEGEKTFSCKCGHSYTEKIAKLKHKYTSEITKPASCAEKGVKTFTCSGCSKSYTEDIAKLKHEYTTTEQKPSCTEAGYMVHTCKCGHSYKEKYRDPIGHTWSPWVTVVEPTETAKGEAKRECSVCDASETKPIEVGEHIHNYTTTVVEPQCRKDGYTLYTCACGDSYKDNIVKAPGHDNVLTYFEGSCTENGYTRYECQVCGNVYDDVTDWAEGHTWSDWVTNKEPTETEPGTETRTCSVCGETNSQVIPATGEIRDTYIDPSIEVEYVGSGRYSYRSDDPAVSVVTECSWNCYLSIHILENGDWDISYYKQDGTKVTCLLEYREGRMRFITIQEDSSYTLSDFGSFGGE